MSRSEPERSKDSCGVCFRTNMTSPAGTPGYRDIVSATGSERWMKEVVGTSSSPAPASTMRCRSDIPFSTKISWRFFSLTIFSPLHFLHLRRTNRCQQESNGYLATVSYLSFSRSFSPSPLQSLHRVLPVPIWVEDMALVVNVHPFPSQVPQVLGFAFPFAPDLN